MDAQLRAFNKKMNVMFFSEDTSHLLSELGSKVQVVIMLEAMPGLSSLDFFFFFTETYHIASIAGFLIF